MPKRIGVYEIRNTKNGKSYIGSAMNVTARLNAHRHMLRHGKHHAVGLQISFDKHGEAAFTFLLIEECAAEDRIAREQHWMDILKTANPRHGYNIAKVAGTRAGVPQTEHQKETLRAVHKGKPKSAEHRAKIAAAHLGKPKHTAESKARISDIVKAQFEADADRRAKSAEAGRRNGIAGRGRVHSEQSRANMSTAHVARFSGPESEAIRARMAAAQVGKHDFNDEYRAKLSAGQLRSWTPERRAKQAEITRARHAARRARANSPVDA